MKFDNKTHLVGAKMQAKDYFFAGFFGSIAGALGGTIGMLIGAFAGILTVGFLFKYMPHLQFLGIDGDRFPIERKCKQSCGRQEHPECSYEGCDWPVNCYISGNLKKSIHGEPICDYHWQFEADLELIVQRHNRPLIWQFWMGGDEAAAQLAMRLIDN